jgi:hypothetical protein
MLLVAFVGCPLVIALGMYLVASESYQVGLADGRNSTCLAQVGRECVTAYPFVIYIGGVLIVLGSAYLIFMIAKDNLKRPHVSPPT